MCGADDGVASVLGFRALVRGLAANGDAIPTHALAGHLEITVQMWWLKDDHGFCTRGEAFNERASRAGFDFLVGRDQQFQGGFGRQVVLFERVQRVQRLHDATFHVVSAWPKRLVPLHPPDVLPEAHRVHGVAVRQVHDPLR